MLSGDSGSTLVGELVAVAILGLALVVLLSAISTGMMGMAIVERRVVGENLARRQLEEIKGAEYQENYPAIPVAGPYSVTVTVTHWVSPTGPFTTAMQSPDSGLQCIAVTVSHDGKPAARLEGFKVRR